MTQDAFPLGMADEGARLQIVSYIGAAGLAKRMTEMGFNIGAELIVCQRHKGGVVVMRGEARFALGGGMAHKVIVAPSETN